MTALSPRLASCRHCEEQYRDGFARLCVECRYVARRALTDSVAAHIRKGEDRQRIDATLRDAPMMTPAGQALSARLVVDNNPERARYTGGAIRIGRTA